jgi:hypothetical protein
VSAAAIAVAGIMILMKFMKVLTATVLPIRPGLFGGIPGFAQGAHSPASSQ